NFLVARFGVCKDGLWFFLLYLIGHDSRMLSRVLIMEFVESKTFWRCADFLNAALEAAVTEISSRSSYYSTYGRSVARRNSCPGSRSAGRSCCCSGPRVTGRLVVERGCPQ